MENKVNSLGICEKCEDQNITYSILKGSYTYYCNTCKTYITKHEVISENFIEDLSRNIIK